MRHFLNILVVSLFLLTPLSSGFAQNDISTAFTFNCISLYFDSKDDGECHVRYKSKDTWQQALDLVYDARDNQYRGSIVGLEPATVYEIELQTNAGKHLVRTTTLSESFPVGQITRLTDSSKTITIAESGTPEAYHLVMPPENSRATIDVRNASDYTLVIDADYVIVRGLEFKNAARHGILIRENRNHIIIEENHITFWGRIGGPNSFGNTGNFDSGIFAEEGAGHLVIQRNLIDNPRGCSNTWETGHPAGPQAITLINSSGNNIIRYNDLLTTYDHSFNDIFGGGRNFSDKGSPNRDSDIYGNIFRGSHDDAIESEGANMNVRIWGNYIHDTFQHIATASTSKGPLYIFRNIFGTTRSNRKFLGGSMIKTGSRDEFGGGRKFIFHNTALQPGGPLNVFSGHTDPNTITRNNIFHCAGRLAPQDGGENPGDYDYDLFTGLEYGIAKEPHGIRETPYFIESYYLEFYPTPVIRTVKWGKIPVKIGDGEKILTDPVVTVPNPVIDAGMILANFNDDYAGKGPDLGAFETGRPPLRFGRHANSQDWPAWEKY